jgi:Uncharacterized protein conserved in bacteria (DUF2252)
MAKDVASGPAPIIAATEAYERWLHERVEVVESDLKLKHQLMRGSVFAFLRATFYRWASLWQETCPDLAKGPRVMAVGDLHVENFGTWRDTEGRLIWGVNDFDEVARMPYAIDLVRLVTSAIFAKRENGLAIDDAAAAAAVLDGYSQSLEAGGNPFVLEESHSELREMAVGAERDPTKFWGKLAKLPAVIPSKRVQRLLEGWLPKGTLDVTFTSRIAGVGSLGRPRYVAIGNCHGGFAAREVKAWLPSAWGWAMGRPKDHAFAVRLLKRSVRQRDPFYVVKDGWVVRRLGPHCGRIELGQFPKHRDEKAILKAMGRETANLHLATSDQRAKVLRDLAKQKPDWLLEAAQAMAQATEQDWKTFRSAGDGA